MPDVALNKVFSILAANEDKDFVRRILEPEKSDSVINEDGSASTHSMAITEADGVHYVYPTIHKDKYGVLQRYDGDTAFKIAMQSKEAIGFSTHKEADWFEKNWKRIWGKAPRE